MNRFCANYVAEGLKKESEVKNDKYLIDLQDIYLYGKNVGCCGWIQSVKTGLTVFIDTENSKKPSGCILVKYTNDMRTVDGNEYDKNVYPKFRSMYKIISKMLETKFDCSNKFEINKIIKCASDKNNGKKIVKEPENDIPSNKKMNCKPKKYNSNMEFYNLEAEV